MSVRERSTKRMNLDDAITILELPGDCSFSDAKKAYKDLIQIWHSDRHAHSPRLLERANEKTLQLNTAWKMISNLGEIEFNKSRQLEKTPIPRPSGEKKTRRPIKLNSFRPTGVILEPIRSTSLASMPRSLKVVSLIQWTAIFALVFGASLAPQIYSQLALSMYGESFLGVVESCEYEGKRARISFSEHSVIADIPQYLLSLSLNKEGDITYACPEFVNVVALPSDFQHIHLGAVQKNLWVRPLVELAAFIIAPLLALFIRHKKRRR